MVVPARRGIDVPGTPREHISVSLTGCSSVGCREANPGTVASLSLGGVQGAV
jgi:hypothetical protein